MLEKTGTLLENGQSVNVGLPKSYDKHKGTFIGIIIDLCESRGTVIVENQCKEVFEVDTNNVKVRN